VRVASNNDIEDHIREPLNEYVSCSATGRKLGHPMLDKNKTP